MVLKLKYLRPVKQMEQEAVNDAIPVLLNCSHPEI